MRRALLCFAFWGCAGAQLPPQTLLPQDAGRVSNPPQIALAYPPPGSILGGPETVFLAGRVVGDLARGERLDLVLAIDLSRSACQAPGQPVRDGPERCVPRGPGTGAEPGRVVDVELAAARALLALLDPTRTRVGVVSIGGPISRAVHRFEGPDAGFLGAQLELAPTSDFREVASRLDALAAREPDGPTNLAGALRRATLSLNRLDSPAPRRSILLMTDGVPSAPRETPHENLVETLRAADWTARYGVRVLCFAIGEAAEEPVAALEIADRTGGEFYPVSDVAELPVLFELLELDQIAALEVQNLTLDAPAVHRRLGHDGTWDAVAPLTAGINRLRVSLRAAGGTETSHELEVTYLREASSPAVPPELASRREAARTEELTVLSSQVSALEREAATRTRARLAATIARERAAARQAADAQRRELALEVEPPDVSAGPPESPNGR